MRWCGGGAGGVAGGCRGSVGGGGWGGGWGASGYRTCAGVKACTCVTRDRLYRQGLGPERCMRRRPKTMVQQRVEGTALEIRATVDCLVAVICFGKLWGLKLVVRCKTWNSYVHLAKASCNSGRVNCVHGCVFPPLP